MGVVKIVKQRTLFCWFPGFQRAPSSWSPPIRGENKEENKEHHDARSLETANRLGPLPPGSLSWTSTHLVDLWVDSIQGSIQNRANGCFRSHHTSPQTLESLNIREPGSGNEMVSGAFVAPNRSWTNWFHRNPGWSLQAQAVQVPRHLQAAAH